jgi:glycosyltransferase involved in cell wall biosynthesis
MPTAMIGFDALPMTDPENYRFRPDRYSRVSDYFRKLSTSDVVICISDYSRETIIQRLRRDSVLRTTVAHPGGDHLPLLRRADDGKSGPITFLRVGTMEARKRPVELVQAFRAARESGANAELIFVGRPSASDARINATLNQAVEEDIGVRWFQSLGDSEIHQLVTRADYFVSVGVEGFGIPVLEAIRLGTPVLYGGIQPAGEMMQGMGATTIGGDDTESLMRMFHDYASTSTLSRSLGHVQGHEVPSWDAFTRGVVNAILATRQ